MPHFQSHSKSLLTHIFSRWNFPLSIPSNYDFWSSYWWIMRSNESSHFLDSNFQTINNNAHYQCHLCQQHFLFQSEFKMHLKEHGQQVNFICPQCQLSGNFFKECGVTGQWIKSIGWQSKTILVTFFPLLNLYLPVGSYPLEHLRLNIHFQLPTKVWIL